MGEAARLDVITMGRCSVDLYGQQIGSRLEDITSFAKSNDKGLVYVPF